MNKLSTILVAAVFALSGASALAADPPKADAATTKKAEAALKKPADVTQEAWDKMSDADKKKAVEKAAKATPAAARRAGEEGKEGRLLRLDAFIAAAPGRPVSAWARREVAQSSPAATRRTAPRRARSIAATPAAITSSEM